MDVIQRNDVYKVTGEGFKKLYKSGKIQCMRNSIHETNAIAKKGTTQMTSVIT